MMNSLISFASQITYTHVIMLWIVTLLSVALLIVLAFLRQKKRMFRRQASRNLKALTTLETPQEKFYFLRGQNPFVFEEMILTALKRKGHKIKRNKRYTGDGGIDGQAWINGQYFLIQAKRYKAHINPAHVREFMNICRMRKAHGLFVHTGKTGQMSKDHAMQSHQFLILGGQKMLDLFDLNASNESFMAVQNTQ